MERKGRVSLEMQFIDFDDPQIGVQKLSHLTQYSNKFWCPSLSVKTRVRDIFVFAFVPVCGDLEERTCVPWCFRSAFNKINTSRKLLQQLKCFIFGLDGARSLIAQSISTQYWGSGREVNWTGRKKKRLDFALQNKKLGVFPEPCKSISLRN